MWCRGWLPTRRTPALCAAGLFRAYEGFGELLFVAVVSGAVVGFVDAQIVLRADHAEL